MQETAVAWNGWNTYWSLLADTQLTKPFLCFTGFAIITIMIVVENLHDKSVPSGTDLQVMCTHYAKLK